MITVEQVSELERACRYFLQQCSHAKNAITSLDAMKTAGESVSPDMRAMAKMNAERQERFVHTAGEDLRQELDRVLPDSAAAVMQTQEFDERTS